VSKSDKNIYKDPRVPKHPDLSEKQIEQLAKGQLKNVPNKEVVNKEPPKKK